MLLLCVSMMLHGCTPGPHFAAALPAKHLLQLMAAQILVLVVHWLQLALPHCCC